MIPIRDFNSAAAEFDRLFRRDYLHLSDYCDKMLAAILHIVALDIIKLDDKLHELVGQYEDEGLSMREAIERRYGVEAANFIDELL